MKKDDLKDILDLLENGRNYADDYMAHRGYDNNQLARFDSAIEKVQFELDTPTSPISVTIEFNKDEVDQWMAESAAKYMPIKRQE